MMIKSTLRLTSSTCLSAGLVLFVAAGCRPADTPNTSSGAPTNSTASPTASRTPANAEPVYRGILGGDSWKIRIENGRTYLWAGGDQTGPGSQWYDFTGSLIPAAELQYGIGKDRIPSIDDPLFVDPDDPRLLAFLPESPYRPQERPKTNDEIPVIGYTVGDDVRAYPVALLDRHELVNDLIDGKPVTVGWWPLANLSVVHGRKIEGRLDEFGVSGYVYKNVFLIYDRKSESLWYPLDHENWTAISGPRKGENISFIDEPDVIPLGEWRREHPDTKVLLGSKRDIERKEGSG